MQVVDFHQFLIYFSLLDDPNDIATKNVLCTESSLYTFMGLRRQGGACTYDRSVTSCTLRRAGRTLRGHAPYVAHGPQNAFRTGSLIGRHLYLCTMTVVVT